MILLKWPAEEITCFAVCLFDTLF